MKEHSKVRKIAFVGDHLPRRCGTSGLVLTGNPETVPLGCITRYSLRSNVPKSGAGLDRLILVELQANSKLDCNAGSSALLSRPLHVILCDVTTYD